MHLLDPSHPALVDCSIEDLHWRWLDQRSSLYPAETCVMATNAEASGILLAGI